MFIPSPHSSYSHVLEFIPTVQYPVEYLNTINVSGIPLAKLKLKIGAPIMILQNIDPSQELCNGTCAILTQASELLRLC